MDVFIVRKPVLDRFSRVYGYKLLHSNVSVVGREDNSADTALQLIDNSMLVFDLDALAAGKKVFFTFTPEALDNTCAELLPPETTVVDLHWSVEPTEDNVAACRSLRQSGFTLSAPLRFERTTDGPLLDIADIVSVDFRQCPVPDTMRERLNLLGREKTILARGVDSLDDYQRALDLGCTFVEGEFFSKPVIVAGRDLPGFKPNYLQLLRALNEPELNLRVIGEIISREVSLAYKLLRLMNSAVFGLRVKVTSIERALLMLGERGIRQWATVIAVSELSGSAPSELVTTSAVRGRFCQLVGERLGANDRAHDLFLMGLFSMLDVIASRPLESALDELGIDGPIKEALTGVDNELRPVFQLVLAYEDGAWDEVSDLAGHLGLQRGDLPGIYLPAVEWATSTVTMTA